VLIVGCVGLFLNVLAALILLCEYSRLTYRIAQTHLWSVSADGNGADGSVEKASTTDVEAGLSQADTSSGHLPNRLLGPEQCDTIIQGPESDRYETPLPHHSYGHCHAHGHDFGFMGILIHILADAANNVGVIIAAAIIWKTTSPARFYLDPIVSMLIGVMISASSLSLVYKSGLVLIRLPKCGDFDEIKSDLENVRTRSNEHQSDC